ncbi:hypothetical protein MPH_06934 [Macrophomina phaseolina MS6]|uniref:Uncharacterized protein n=1 Tax=Macrophomina phaseolina (strain MS6) TaxID=1126212 RepID=K2R0V0_MACPH|nr:hypothetical protein MPH_06934 [Macrophomina phaseolina MS6]
MSARSPQALRIARDDYINRFFYGCGVAPKALLGRSEHQVRVCPRSCLPIRRDYLRGRSAMPKPPRKGLDWLSAKLPRFSATLPMRPTSLKTFVIQKNREDSGI